MNYDLVAYAQDFISFFLQNVKAPNKIEAVILFGSAVRGEAKKSSDVDIFIHTKENIEDEIQKIKEEFYKSVKMKKYWTLLGIGNELHCEAGKLEEWKELESSLIAQGIVLYGKYKSKKQGELYYLFSIEQSKKERRIFLYGENYTAINKK